MAARVWNCQQTIAIGQGRSRCGLDLCLFVLAQLNLFIGVRRPKSLTHNLVNCSFLTQILYQAMCTRAENPEGTWTIVLGSMNMEFVSDTSRTSNLQPVPSQVRAVFLLQTKSKSKSNQIKSNQFIAQHIYTQTIYHNACIWADWSALSCWTVSVSFDILNTAVWWYDARFVEE